MDNTATMPLGEWLLTDDSCYQHCQRISPTEFNCIQMISLPSGPMGDLYCVYQSMIDIDDYEEDVDDILQSFGYTSLERVKECYGEAWKQIIAECAFETSIYAGLVPIDTTYDIQKGEDIINQYMSTHPFPGQN